MNPKLTAVTTCFLAAILTVWILSATVAATTLAPAYAVKKTYSATFKDTKTGEEKTVTGTKGEIRSAFAKELDKGGVKGAQKDNALKAFDAGADRADKGADAAAAASEHKPVAFSDRPVALDPCYRYCYSVLWWTVCFYICW